MTILTLAKPPTYRQQLTESMALCLKDSGAASEERAAIRWLFGHGYAMADIVMCIDDARQAAVQDAVAREMSAP